MEREIARIVSTSLGWEDHGIFTCSLRLDYGGAGQSAGGYALDTYDADEKRRVGTAYGLEFIARLMKACGVSEWEKVKGRTVIALIEHARVVGIAPLPTEPGEAFEFKTLSEVAA